MKINFVIMLSSALFLHGFVQAQTVYDESVFGSQKKQNFEHDYKNSAPQDKGGYLIPNKDEKGRYYLGDTYRGSDYLSRSHIHSCKQYIHIATKDLKTTAYQISLIDASLRRNLVVRLLTNPPQSERDSALLHDLAYSGVSVRIISEPLLDVFSVCDTNQIYIGTQEVISDNRVSYGSAVPLAVYDNKNLASAYEVRWQKLWGQGSPLQLKSDYRNTYWNLFGEEERIANKPITSYKKPVPRDPNQGDSIGFRILNNIKNSVSNLSTRNSVHYQEEPASKASSGEKLSNTHMNPNSN